MNKNPHKVTSSGIKVKLLYIQSDKKNITKAKKQGFVEIRVIPDEYKSSVALELYGLNVCIILENIIIKISDEKIVKRFRLFFDSLWKIGKEI